MKILNWIMGFGLLMMTHASLGQSTYYTAKVMIRSDIIQKIKLYAIDNRDDLIIFNHSEPLNAYNHWKIRGRLDGKIDYKDKSEMPYWYIELGQEYTRIRLADSHVPTRYAWILESPADTFLLEKLHPSNQQKAGIVEAGLYKSYQLISEEEAGPSRQLRVRELILICRQSRANAPHISIKENNPTQCAEVYQLAAAFITAMDLKR